MQANQKCLTVIYPPTVLKNAPPQINVTENNKTSLSLSQHFYMS